MRRLFILVGILGALGVAPSQPAHAWDPSTTHQAILEQAALRSAMHVRWMNSSELQRGLFTPLRVDPARLDERERRLIELAQRRAHADSGARALGGPGSCPGADAPPSTQLACVDGDVWESSGLGWLRLGIVAETTPTARLVHHFLDRRDPGAKSWDDEELSRTVLRVRQSRSNGAPTAGVATLTNFSGDGPSALAWLVDGEDPLAPARMYAHLEQASKAESLDAREHHLAMALVCAGALLHVMQDLSVPAHARGDVTAFFAPLSRTPGDRGLPLQEYVREQWGRGPLPGLPEPPPVAEGLPLAASLRGHVLGEGAYEGLGRTAASRFLSESSLPRPRAFADDTTPEAAAAIVLERSGLDAVELEGARLTPWPSESGYLVTGTGRPLAAFDTDEAGRTRFFLDEAVYRDQAHALLPRAVDASRSVLDLVFVGFPALRPIAGGSVMELDVPAEFAQPVLTLMLQDARGERVIHQRVQLRPGESNRIVGLPTPHGDGERVVLVLEATGANGAPIVTEHQVAAKAAAVPPTPNVVEEDTVDEDGPSEDADTDEDPPPIPAPKEATEPDPAETETDAEPEPKPEPRSTKAAAPAPDPKAPGGED